MERGRCRHRGALPSGAPCHRVPRPRNSSACTDPSSPSPGFSSASSRILWIGTPVSRATATPRQKTQRAAKPARDLPPRWTAGATCASQARPDAGVLFAPSSRLPKAPSPHLLRPPVGTNENTPKTDGPACAPDSARPAPRLTCTTLPQLPLVLLIWKEMKSSPSMPGQWRSLTRTPSRSKPSWNNLHFEMDTSIWAALQITSASRMSWVARGGDETAAHHQKGQRGPRLPARPALLPAATHGLGSSPAACPARLPSPLPRVLPSQRGP